LLQEGFAKSHLLRVELISEYHDLKTSHVIEQFINDLNSIKVRSHFTAPQLTLWTLLAPENWEIMSIKKQEKVMEVFQLFQYNTPNSNPCKMWQRKQNFKMGNFRQQNDSKWPHFLLLELSSGQNWQHLVESESVEHDNSCLTYYHTLLKMGHFESENYSL